MFRPLLLLLLTFFSIRSAHAQDSAPDSPAPPSISSGYDARPTDSAGLRLVLDSRLIPPADVDSSLTTRIPLTAPAPRAFASNSYWKTGAVVGGVVGALAGFGFGYAIDNIENQGNTSVGEATIGSTVIGALGGGLIGAGIGSLIRR